MIESSSRMEGEAKKRPSREKAKVSVVLSCSYLSGPVFSDNHGFSQNKQSIPAQPVIDNIVILF